MRNFIFFIITFIAFSQCGTDNTEKRIDELETKLANEPSYENQLILADSLLNLDSQNTNAIKIKGIHYYNENIPDSSNIFLRKVLAANPYDTISTFMIGWNFQRMNELDSMEKYWNSAIQLMDKHPHLYAYIPQIITILQGSDSGITYLEEHSDNFNPNYSNYLKNDINTYTNEKLGDFWPFGMDPDSTYIVFRIKVQDSLYDNKTLNNSTKISDFLASNGVNSFLKATEHSDKSFQFRMHPKYLKRLTEIPDLEVELLKND